MGGELLVLSSLVCGGGGNLCPPGEIIVMDSCVYIFRLARLITHNSRLNFGPLVNIHGSSRINPGGVFFRIFKEAFDRLS